VDVAGHPGVDDVVDVVELGGTHEESGRGGCDAGENRRGSDLDWLRAHGSRMDERERRVNANDYAFVTDIYT